MRGFWGGATSVVLAILLAGCPAPPGTPSGALPEPPPGLWDQVVADGTVVVPGDRWSVQKEKFWAFQNRASFVVWRDAEDKGDLRIRLRPAPNAAGQHFRVFWDGQELPAAALARRDDVIIVTVTPDEISGHHRLTLRRDYKPETVSSRRNVRSVFRRVEFFREGNGTWDALDTAALPRYRQIASFIDHGVVGDGVDQRGGLLMLGAGRHAVRWTRQDAVELHVEPRNLSAKAAAFTLALGDETRSVELGPGEHRALELPLGQGDGEVVLSVDGEPGGLYLWGMPRLRNSASRTLVPIVLVTLDTTRRDALSPYNGRRELTPNLDDFAAGATVYTQAFSTAPWTLPSHASIMTGLYPSRHGAGTHEVALGGDAITLAGLLRERGYLTAGFSSGELSSSRFGLARGFHRYRNPDQFETPGGDLDGYLQALLDEHGEEPLFLFVNYFDPHALYEAPAHHEKALGVPALREKLRGRPVWGDLADGDMAAWRGVIDGEGGTGDEDVRAFLENAYLAEVAWVDELLGRLFDRLRRLGLYDRALVVVTADHGELLGEGGFFSHGARLDPELVEIPLLVKWPGQKRPDEMPPSDGRLTSLVDLFPTVLEAVGLEAPPSDGLSLLPGDGDGKHPYVLFEEHVSLVHPLPSFMEISPHLFGVQRPNVRHLVWEGGESCARWRSGGWQEVPCEGNGDVLEAIRQQLLPPSDTPEAGDEVTDEVRRRLEALGYMGFESKKKR